MYTYKRVHSSRRAETARVSTRRRVDERTAGQRIVITRGFHACRFTYSPELIYNPNPVLEVLTLVHRHAQGGGSAERPNTPFPADIAPGGALPSEFGSQTLTVSWSGECPVSDTYVLFAGVLAI